MKHNSQSLRVSEVGIPDWQQYNDVHLEHAVRIRRKRSYRASMTSPTPRQETDALTQQSFDELLGWLNSDREIAGQIYVKIRTRLTKIFVSRGTNNPEDLADATINRVARKLPEIQPIYVGDPENYFKAVVRFILQESYKKEKAPVAAIPMPVPANSDDEMELDCLDRALSELTAEDRNLIIEYYRYSGHEKIEHRKVLAEQMGFGLNPLRIRACRLRGSLARRIEELRTEVSAKRTLSGSRSQ
jgi:hypothetical protein